MNLFWGCCIIIIIIIIIIVCILKQHQYYIAVIVRSTNCVLTEIMSCQLLLSKISLCVASTLVDSSLDTSPFNLCSVSLPLYVRLFKSSLFSVNTSTLSFHVFLPRFPQSSLPSLCSPTLPSHSQQRTFGKILQTCLLALLSSSFAENPNHWAPMRCFTVVPSKDSRNSRWSWLSAFSHTLATTENVIYQPECDPPLGNMTVLTVFWRLSSLSLIVGLDYHKSKLSMTKHHTSLCYIFRAIQ